jgi:hypothetical protein
MKVADDTMAEVILYDIPTRGRASCFSHNVWKSKSPANQPLPSIAYLVSNPVPARLVFNYKKIPYKTIWLEHKDIESTLKSMYKPPLPSLNTLPPTQLTISSQLRPTNPLPNRLPTLHPAHNPSSFRRGNFRLPRNRAVGRRNLPNSLPSPVLITACLSSPKSRRSSFSSDPSLHAPDSSLHSSS